jgi:hypothetical protein
MRRVVLAFSAAAVLCVHGRADAQDAPAPFPRVVLDLHGIVPVFPNDNLQLANSRFVSELNRPLSVGELPGAGFGGRIGVHAYLFKWKAITFGIGGEVFSARSSSTPPDASLPLVPVAERLTSGDGQVSFNFGSGHGWSYLSGGFGRSQWSILPAGQSAASADAQSLPTANYGGGAHWSIKRHVGFSLDVRLYEIQPGSPTSVGPGSPRTRLLVVGAGIFLK